jgi:hypothetical protein
LGGDRSSGNVVGIKWASGCATVADTRLLSAEALTLGTKQRRIDSVDVGDEWEGGSACEEQGGGSEGLHLGRYDELLYLEAKRMSAFEKDSGMPGTYLYRPRERMIISPVGLQAPSLL